ncbi:hypothetical protein ACJX0J_016173 [Zea mays]
MAHGGGGDTYAAVKNGLSVGHASSLHAMLHNCRFNANAAALVEARQLVNLLMSNSPENFLNPKGCNHLRELFLNIWDKGYSILEIGISLLLVTNDLMLYIFECYKGKLRIKFGN